MKIQISEISKTLGVLQFGGWVDFWVGRENPSGAGGGGLGFVRHF